jgi:predicted anti-sigma-YlaC factor YlaD
MSTECEYLDAFLDGDLSSEVRDLYEAHLHLCEACREAVNQQRWIDDLLSSPERLELIPVPANVSQPLRNLISRRRQVRLVACGLAGAAVIVIAVGWTAALNWQARVAAVNQIVEASVVEHEPSPSPSLQERGTADAPQATFVAGRDVLAVPVASRYPNVTIVRVYPTYQSSFAAKAMSDESEADYFNGG